MWAVNGEGGTIRRSDLGGGNAPAVTGFTRAGLAQMGNGQTPGGRAREGFDTGT